MRFLSALLLTLCALTSPLAGQQAAPAAEKPAPAAAAVPAWVCYSRRWRCSA